MISQTAEYALRAAVCLGSRPGQSLTVREIAKATRVPESYLAKLLQTLSRVGLLISRRGFQGGFALARNPKQITALEVINAVDPFKRIEDCPMGLGDRAKLLCALHRRIDESMAAVERQFRACTIQELVGPSNSDSASCTFPRERKNMGWPKCAVRGGGIPCLTRNGAAAPRNGNHATAPIAVAARGRKR